MLKYILKRLLGMIIVWIGVVFIVFAINRLTPGDPAFTILGAEATEEQYAAVREELGLNDPLLVQFYNYMKGLVTEFDLGTSYKTARPVAQEILERYPTSLKLALIGLGIALLLGIPLGILAATKQYSVFDYGSTILALFFASMPNFWLALMLIIIISLNWGLLPASGLFTWQHWILPSLAVAAAPLATITRFTRSSMLEVVRQDYIRTARAKGLKEIQIIMRHEFKNALIPVITVAGIQIGVILCGAVVVEAIFAIPGLGSLIMTAINNKDYPLIQGSVLVLSITVSVLNLLVDLLYTFIDPRINIQSSSKKKIRKARKLVTGEDGV